MFRGGRRLPKWVIRYRDASFQSFALIQINRQPLSGRNVLRRNVSLFEEMSPWVTLEWAG